MRGPLQQPTTISLRARAPVAGACPRANHHHRVEGIDVRVLSQMRFLCPLRIRVLVRDFRKAVEIGRLHETGVPDVDSAHVAGT